MVKNSLSGVYTLKVQSRSLDTIFPTNEHIRDVKVHQKDTMLSMSSKITSFSSSIRLR